MCCLYSFTLKHIIKHCAQKILCFHILDLSPISFFWKLSSFKGRGTPSLRTQKIEVSLRQGQGTWGGRLLRGRGQFRNVTAAILQLRSSILKQRQWIHTAVWNKVGFYSRLPLFSRVARCGSSTCPKLSWQTLLLLTHITHFIHSRNGICQRW